MTTIGAIAGAAALAAAGYLLFGPDGKKNRKTLKSWSLRMKAEILEKMEKTKDLTQETYHDIVDEVAESYTKNKKVTQAELKEAVSDLKKRWKTLKKSASARKPAKRRAKRG